MPLRKLNAKLLHSQPSRHFSQSFVARPFKCRPIRPCGLKGAVQAYLTVCQSHLREQGLIGWMVGPVRMNRPQQEVCEKCGLGWV